jgi:hypothetical protein
LFLSGNGDKANLNFLARSSWMNPSGKRILWSGEHLENVILRRSKRKSPETKGLFLS